MAAVPNWISSHFLSQEIWTGKVRFDFQNFVKISIVPTYNMVISVAGRVPQDSSWQLLESVASNRGLQ